MFEVFFQALYISVTLLIERLRVEYLDVESWFRAKFGILYANSLVVNYEKSTLLQSRYRVHPWPEPSLSCMENNGCKLLYWSADLQ
jgi:hypothetical protein